MRIIIHGTCKDGIEDSIVIKGETIDELSKIAKAETDKRGWEDCWSEEIRP